MKSQVRDLGFISWMDSLAAYEDVSSKEFSLATLEQKAIHVNALAQVDTSLRKAWVTAFNALPKTYPFYYSFRWAGHTLHVSQHNRYIPTVSITVINGQKYNFGSALAFGVTNSHFWIIQDQSNGKEDLSLSLYSTTLRKLKTLQFVGDTAASQGDRLYFVGAKNTFWFNTICLVDSAKDRKQIYSEADPRFVLSLHKPKGQDDIFVIRKSALNQDIGYIDETRIVWLARGIGRKLPISRTELAFNSYFSKDRTRISYPNEMYLVDVYKRGSLYLFILCKDTKQGLYVYRESKWEQLLAPRTCDILFSEHSEDIIVGYPNAPDRVLHLNKLCIPVLIKELQGPKYRLEHGESPIPWFVTFPNSKPKGIVICGYGAYGMSVRKHQQRLWLPWLARGFAIANLCVRGGGDNGDYWWDAARGPTKRKYAVRDFIVGVSLLQKRYGFNSTNTIVYGRSAGGFLVTAAMFELVDKVAVVYAAKPYTDVLRTVTNPNEKQALLETGEFGFIRDEKDVGDFCEIAKLSPYENIPLAPPVHPAVILTGGMNDTEVPIYMPIRFVKRLQLLGWKNAVCRITDGEGHFTRRDKEYGEAYDAALCESFINEGLKVGQFT